MTDQNDRDEDRRSRRDDESLEDALEDLGRSMTRFMQKVVEKSEEMFSESGFEDLFGSPGEGFGGGSTGTRRKRAEKSGEKAESAGQREPAVDVFDEGDEVLIYVELPGVESEHIDVQMKEGVLTLRAESHGGTYEKRIPVPEGVSQTPDYQFKNGILKIQLKKGPSGAAE